MKSLTLSILFAGLISNIAMAEDKCTVAYQAQNYQQAAECYVKQLKKERSFYNLEMAGISYVKLGRYKDALPYLKEAEKQVPTSVDYKILCSWLGNVYSSIGDSTQELVYLMKHLDLSLKLDSRESIGAAYGNLGLYYYSQNQTQKALEYYEKALEYEEELDSAVIYGNMALAYHTLENYPKAEEMHQKAILIDQKSGDYHSLGAHKTELGNFYFTQNRNSEARTVLKDALVINSNSGRIDLKSRTLSCLAEIDYREGHINESKEKAAEALRLAKQSGDTEDAKVVWNLVNGK